MAMFVVLGKLTDQGAKNIQTLRKTVDENMARGQHLGIKIHGWYLTQGRYDIVVVAEAPDAETMLANAAGVAGTGNTRTETLRAFTLDEADQVIKRVGGA
jgi:uncharacterized protein with GYD domain